MGKRIGWNPMAKIELIHKEIEKLVKILQKEIAISGVANIFHNTLFHSDEPIDSADSKKIAAYIFIHQLIFYENFTSSIAQNTEYPSIAYLLKENDIIGNIRTAFAKVKKINNVFQKVFEFDVISTIDPTKSETIVCICRYILSLSKELEKGDILGKVFHKMIPLTLRKHVASYFTLDIAAKILANLVITEENQIVIDPACGSGTLLIEAYEAKKKYKMMKGSFGLPDHTRFLEEEIFGLDIMPFSLYLANLNLIMKNICAIPRKMNLFLTDSNLIYQKTQRNIEIMDIIDTKDFDVVIMNPPFTKKQLIKDANKFNSNDKKYRDILKMIYESEYSNSILTNKSPLYSYFLLIADRLLETKVKTTETKEKFIAAVLPIVFLQSENEKALRNYLKNKYLWKYIIINEVTGNFSEDTQLSEVLLVLQKKPSENSLKISHLEKIQYIFLKNLDESKLEEIVGSIKNNSILQNEFITKVQIDAQDINFENLFYPISLGSMNIDYLKEWSIIRKSDVFKSLGAIPNVFVESKNSPEPRACKLNFKEMIFVEQSFKKNAIDPEILTIEPQTLNIRYKDGKISKIKRENLKLALKYPSKVSQIDISSINQFVLYDNDGEFHFKDNDIDWEIWKKYVDERTANLAIIDRVNYIRPGVSHFAFYTDQPRVISRNLAAIKGLDPLHAKLLALWINSSFGILEWISTSVPQQLSFCQHHKKTLINIKILNPAILTNDEFEEMNQIFNQIGKIKFPSLLDQFIALVSQEFKEKYKEHLIKIKKIELASTGFRPRTQLDYFILKIILNHCKDAQSNVINNNYEIVDEIIRNTHERVAWLLIMNLTQNHPNSGEDENGFESGDIAKI